MQNPDVHAAAFTALIRTLRRCDAWLGGAVEGEDWFPPTDGEHLAELRFQKSYIDFKTQKRSRKLSAA